MGPHKEKWDAGRFAINMDRIGCIILGGGQGTRLFPLTTRRCKPAVPFGGRYRLIDIPISNALHAGCEKLFILTQFLSSSLHRHISQSYPNLSTTKGFVEVLGVEQKSTNSGWYQGTADAVRQNLSYLTETPVDYFLILSGDQLYNMNLQEMIAFAFEKDADLVVASLPVEEKEAKRMGLLKLNDSQEVVDFYEKPQDDAILKLFEVPASMKKRVPKNYLGSMGIYLFKKQTLIQLLADDLREDFGKHLIPTAVKQGGVYSYLFDGYWEDIGTVETFFHANLALTAQEPKFQCHLDHAPIYSGAHHLPGPKIKNTRLKETIVCEGSLVSADRVTRSILGPRTIVGEETVIDSSYIMGNDYYAHPAELRNPHMPSIGMGCVIKNAIIDTNVFIGNDVEITNREKLTHYDSDLLFIRDGVVVIPHGVRIPNGFKI
jgi:glucose-1-phosphate adenylyltransferase